MHKQRLTRIGWKSVIKRSFLSAVIFILAGKVSTKLQGEYVGYVWKPYFEVFSFAGAAAFFLAIGAVVTVFYATYIYDFRGKASGRSDTRVKRFLAGPLLATRVNFMIFGGPLLVGLLALAPAVLTHDSRVGLVSTADSPNRSDRIYTYEGYASGELSRWGPKSAKWVDQYHCRMDATFRVASTLLDDAESTYPELTFLGELTPKMQAEARELGRSQYVKAQDIGDYSLVIALDEADRQAKGLLRNPGLTLSEAFVAAAEPCGSDLLSDPELKYIEESGHELLLGIFEYSFQVVPFSWRDLHEPRSDFQDPVSEKLLNDPEKIPPPPQPEKELTDGDEILNEDGWNVSVACEELTIATLDMYVHRQMSKSEALQWIDPEFHETFLDLGEFIMGELDSGAVAVDEWTSLLGNAGFQWCIATHF